MAKGVGRNGELFARLVEPGWLIERARLAARGKRRRPDVAAFLLDLEPRCYAIADALRAGTWRPGRYHAFWIHDPKRRLISAAPFADRVVHHALVGLLEPVFERRFVAHSYACRKGKGTHRALYRAHALARKHRYVLRADLVKFFPSLDHCIVQDEVRRVIADERLLGVLDTVIEGSNRQEDVWRWFSGDDLFTPLQRRRGLPIGNLTSQFLANVVLDRLDHLVTDELGFGAYVRYCDDFLVFGDDKARLREARERVRVLLDELRLTLHPRKTGVVGTCSPIPFLGFVLHGPRRRLHRKAIQRASDRLRARAAAVARRELPVSLLRASVVAWLAHAGHGHSRSIAARVVRCATVRSARGTRSGD